MGNDNGNAKVTSEQFTIETRESLAGRRGERSAVRVIVSVSENGELVDVNEQGEVVIEEAPVYAYGISVSLEPGEAAPEYAAHADVEEADSGWDKIERVHNIAYTTTNQDVARENWFALLDVEDAAGYTSWGTFDCRQIEMGDYKWDADDSDVDIYTEKGAEAALRAANEEAEAEAAQARERASTERAEQDALDSRRAESLKAAGIEVTPWALNVARQAEYHLQGRAGKFSRSYLVDLEPEVRQAQQQANQLVADAKNKVHARASRILNAVQASKAVAS